jgi:phospholipid transport system substrate-binding protein
VGDQLVGIINSPGSFADKRARLRAIVDRTVDVEGIARFCLGRYWHLATPDQQREYVAIFHDVLVNSITGHLGEYKGVHYTLGRVTPHDDNTVWVTTTIYRPNNPPADVQWVIASQGGGFKIEDLVVEGTSLRITQRSDYTSYLQHHDNNVGDLIAAMRRLLAQQSEQQG